MRQNLPITDIEHPFPDDVFLISKTDKQGTITYANRGFCLLAGFPFEELLGQPHNIVRHPDMPSSVFEGMWQDINNGQEWHGLVKNRCKNGDFYWVDATVTPIYNQEQSIIGFISVRRKAAQDAVDQAAAQYQALNT